MGDIRHFAEHVISERGVRHGRLVACRSRSPRKATRMAGAGATIYTPTSARPVEPLALPSAECLTSRDRVSIYAALSPLEC
ncbi:MAG TPA: hypothetical protein VK432_03110 [Stellaceae bacterium]|nr:hypothetical protein [Stellaceae bacterium]